MVYHIAKPVSKQSLEFMVPLLLPTVPYMYIHVHVRDDISFTSKSGNEKCYVVTLSERSQLDY